MSKILVIMFVTQFLMSCSTPGTRILTTTALGSIIGAGVGRTCDFNQNGMAFTVATGMAIGLGVGILGIEKEKNYYPRITFKNNDLTIDYGNITFLDHIRKNVFRISKEKEARY